MQPLIAPPPLRLVIVAPASELPLLEAALGSGPLRLEQPYVCVLVDSEDALHAALAAPVDMLVCRHFAAPPAGALPSWCRVEALARASRHDVPIVLVSDLDAEPLREPHDACVVCFTDRLHWLPSAVRRALAAQATRRQSRYYQALYEALFARSRDVIYIHDQQGRFLDANPAALELLGCSQADFGRMSFADLLSPGQLPQAIARTQRLTGGECLTDTSEYVVRRCDDGTPVLLETRTTLVGQAGSTPLVLGIARDVTERRRGEEALRRSEQQLREILESAHLFALVLDRDGRVSYCNDFLLEMTGYRREEIVGEAWLEKMIPAEDLPLVQEIFDEAMRSGSLPPHFSNCLRTRTGARRLVSWNNTVQRDAEGRIVGTLSIGEDVTERAATKGALERRLQAERLHALVSSWFIDLPASQIDEGIKQALALAGGFFETERVSLFEFSADGRRLQDPQEWQRAGSTMPAAQKEVSAEGLPWLVAQLRRLSPVIVDDVERLPPEASAEREQWRARGLRSLAVVPLVRRGALLGVLSLGQGGHARGFDAEDVALLRMIANTLVSALQRKRTDAQLRESEQRYRALVEATPDLYLRLDRNCTHLDVHARPGVSLFAPASEAIGRTVREMLPASTAAVLEQGVEETFRTGQARTVELPLSMPDGEHDFEVRLGLSAPGEVVAIVRDITEVRHVQRQLLHADRLATVGTLAAGVAHEINNPLAYVLGNVSFVADELTHVPEEARVGELRQALLEAKEGAERVRQIVRNLRLFSRVDEVRTGAVDLRRVLDLAVNMAQNEIRHRARLVRSEEQVPFVAGNEGKLCQVFLNLLVNAAQAIPDAGGGAHEIRLRLSAQGALVAAEVEDTGVGIAPDVLPRIFDPYFTTKPLGVGTGLGLSISQSIVHALGGRITVQSAPGKGSCFRVELPVSSAAPVSAEVPEPVVPATLDRARVLVIDDEQPVVASLVRLLRNEAQVDSATSGQRALELLAAGADYDLVLCDLMMPGITGMDVYEEALRLRPALAPRFVVMTGGAFTPRAREFLESSNVRRLDKPFDPAAVRRLVREAVSER